MSTPKWMKIGEVAKRLGLSVATIRRLSDKGMIPCTVTEGGTRLYDPEHVHMMAARMEKQAKRR